MKLYQKRPDAIQAKLWDGGEDTGKELVRWLKIYGCKAVLNHVWSGPKRNFVPVIEFSMSDGHGNFYPHRLLANEYLMYDGLKVLGSMNKEQFDEIYEEA